MLQSQEHVRRVKFGGVLLEAANLREIEEELAPRAVLEHEEELGWARERVVHLHYEWMAHRSLLSLDQRTRVLTKMRRSVMVRST